MGFNGSEIDVKQAQSAKAQLLIHESGEPDSNAKVKSVTKDLNKSGSSRDVNCLETRKTRK